MIFREAMLIDIEQMSIVRGAVKENVLSNPNLITYDMYADFITKRGKGWVCELDGKIVGFSVADPEDDNVWALFVLPEHEAKGIGKRLHDLMLEWYFSQGKENIWLSTDPDTKAAKFYKKHGWREAGFMKTGEIRFEMTVGERRSPKV